MRARVRSALKDEGRRVRDASVSAKASSYFSSYARDRKRREKYITWKKSGTFTIVAARFDSRVARICPPLPSSSARPTRC